LPSEVEAGKVARVRKAGGLELVGRRSHLPVGRWPVAEAPFKLSRATVHVDGLINRGAACYAEDNEYVLGELLGHSTSDIRGFEAEGVI
jgi:hypothetical protein